MRRKWIEDARKQVKNNVHIQKNQRAVMRYILSTTPSFMRSEMLGKKFRFPALNSFSMILLYVKRSLF